MKLINSENLKIESGVKLKIWGDAKCIKGDASNLIGNVGGIKGDVSKLRGVVTYIQGDVSYITGNVGRLRGDVTNLIFDFGYEREKYIDVNDYIHSLLKKEEKCNV